MGKKDLTLFRRAVRLDLADDGTHWTDDKLSRAIERAFSDFSRMSPKEETYEQMLSFTKSESFTTPKDASSTAIVNAQSLVLAEETQITLAGQPDCPRKLILTVADADGSLDDFTLVLIGTDEFDQAIEEYFHIGQGLVQTSTRLFKRVNELYVKSVTGGAAGDTVSVGYGDFEDTWIYLANRPIKVDSQSIASMTVDTDYEMDFAMGRVKVKAGGSMTAQTAYTISYEVSKIALDMSGLGDIIRVDRVEYPAGQVPRSLVPHEVWGKILTITGSGEISNQEELTELYRLVIYYFTTWNPPTDYSPSDVSDFIENTLIMAAGAYALLEKSVDLNHSANDDLTTMRATLAETDALHALAATALSAIATHLASSLTAIGDADTAVGSITTPLAAVDSALTDADTALDGAATPLSGIAAIRASAATAIANADAAMAAGDLIIPDIVDPLTNMDTSLGNGTTALGNIATVLANIAARITAQGDALTDADTAVTAADGAIANISTALGKIATYLENNSNEDAKSWLTKITTDIASLRTAINTALDACNAYIDSVASDLTTAAAVDESSFLTTGSEPAADYYLETGSPKIDTVPIGEQAGEVYRRFADSAKNAADAVRMKRVDLLQVAVNRSTAAYYYTQEASQRIANLKSYIEQSQGWVNVAGGFYQEAQGRIGVVQAYLAESERYMAMVTAIGNQIQAYIQQAEAYNAEAQGHIGLANGYFNQIQAYIAQVSAWQKDAESWIAIVTVYNEQIRMIIDESNAYIQEGLARIQLAQGYIGEVNAYVAQVNAYLGVADRYQNAASIRKTEADALIQQINSKIAEADRLLQASNLCLQISSNYRTEAIERRNEVWNIWRDRKEYIGNYVVSSTNQPTPP